MARRRITNVIDQQHRLRELGRIRFGDRKGERRPGRPLEFARVSSSSRDVVDAIAEVYGGTPTPWQREEGAGGEWDVKTERPLAIAVPPEITPFTAAFEQWAGGYLTVRCDGATCQYRAKGRWVERACVCEEREQDFTERPCKQTTRMTVMVLGVPILGVFRVETKSYNAAAEVPFTLALLQQSGRAAYMQMRQRSDKVMVWDKKKGEDVPTTRRFWVITVDAPFMPDEIVALSRPASMASLPAPESPALTRGARPQIGAGQIVQPRGPQPEDSEPPPREPPPLDLEPVSGDVVDEGDDDAPIGSGDEDPATAAAADAAWEESRPGGEQSSLPVDEPRRRAEGDA